MALTLLAPTPEVELERGGGISMLARPLHTVPRVVKAVRYPVHSGLNELSRLSSRRTQLPQKATRRVLVFWFGRATEEAMIFEPKACLSD